MRNITLFTVPRHFKSVFSTIQYNALKSWLQLDPTPEIILCGNDEGVAKVAAELRIVHVPDIELSDKGTPLVNSIFNTAQMVAKNDVLAYVNCDIILTNDFLDTIEIITSSIRHRFMIIGQRWDLDINAPINFSDSLWEDNLRKEVEKHGELHLPCGIDYFVFEKGYGMDMPPFSIGRTYYDMWIVSHALRIGYDVVDATGKILAVHSNHEQFHVEEYRNQRDGEESKINSKLAQGRVASVRRANWRFSKDKLLKR